MVQDTNYSDSSAEDDLEEDDSLDSSDDGNADDSSGDDDSKDKKKTAETRINELSGKLKERERELSELKAKSETPAAPASGSETITPEAQKVINQLESLGFTRKGQVDEKFKQIEDRLALDSEHNKLRNEFDGSDGRPKYDKAKIEGYMRERGVYDPEVAYKAMNEAELLDWHLKKAEAGSTKKKPYIEKPGGSGVNRSSDNQITKEKLQEVAENPTPSNRAWYEKNRDKILQMHSEGQFNS